MNPFDFVYKEKHVVIKQYKELPDHFNLWIDDKFCGTRVLADARYDGKNEVIPDPVVDAKLYIDFGMP